MGTTREIQGRDLRIGDAIEFLGKAHRVERFDVPQDAATLRLYPAGRIAHCDDGFRMTVAATDWVRVYGRG